jgi:uncharacterized delta-60 repeat protein
MDLEAITDPERSYIMWFTSRLRKRTVPRTHGPVRRVRPHLEALEDRCLLSGGVLDPTFGTGGIVTTSGGWSGINFNAVATYPNAGTANDGKIVATGQVFTSKTSYFDFIRYNLDGTLDRSFGGSGQVANSSLILGDDVKVQPDGKVVGAGSANSHATGYDFAVVRYNADGSLDTSFGGKAGNGTVTTDINQKSSDLGRHLVLQNDGKIVVAGTTTPSGINLGVSADLALVRYNADGSLDTSFGSGGKVIQHFAWPLLTGGNGVFLDMALDPGSSALDPNTGKIVVVAELNNDRGAVVVRFNANGSLDTSFGGGAGYVSFSTVDIGVEAVQSDDRIVVAWESHGLARLNPDGTPDPSFASGGFAPLPNNSFARSVMIQADGKILAAGYQGGTSGNHFMVARYNATDGSPDTSFGVSGVAVATGVQVGSGFVRAALEPDGRMVVAGIAGSNSFALARFLATGPQIGSFTASPNPVTAGSSVTLTAASVVPFNPGSTVMQVAFYVDSNGDGVLDAGDALLGYGTQAGGGRWTFTLSPAGWAAGTYTLLAQAKDSYGVFSDPLAVPIQVT